MRQSVKRRMWSRVGVIAAVAVGAIGLSLAPAGAVTTTTLGQTSANNTCGADVNAVQTSSVGPSYVVPAGGGLITSWSAATGVFGYTMQLEVWRPVGGTNYTLVGKALAAATEAPNTGVHTYTLSPPIAAQAGDLLGFFATSASPCGTLISGNKIFGNFGPVPAVGATININQQGNDTLMNIAATVEQGQCGPGLTAHYIGVTTTGVYGSAVFCLNAMGIGTLTVDGVGTAPAQIIKAGNVVWFSANGNNLRVSGYLNTSTGASSFVETRPFSVSGKVLTLT